MKTKYRVSFWFDGASYDAAKPADLILYVSAKTASEAEEIGDARCKRNYGKPEVVIADF